jgi:4-hydroxybenzoate polyprenyltransferase
MTSSYIKYLKLCDYFFVLRPMLHLPVWTILILGYYSGSFGQNHRWELLSALLIGTGLFGAVFMINQIYDIESDRINNKLHFLPRGYIKVPVAWAMTVGLNVISLIGAFAMSIRVGLIVAMVVILGVLYSAPPLVLKDRAWSATIANGLGHGTLVYLLGFCAAGGDIVAGITKSLPYFFAVAAVYIGTTLPDIDGDKHTGKLTIGVRCGQNLTIYIIMIIYVLAAISGFMVSDRLFLFAALAASPFYFWALFARSIKAVVLAVKVSIITLTLAAIYQAPLYLLFLVVLIFATRAYYKARFDMAYPSIS